MYSCRKQNKTPVTLLALSISLALAGTATAQDAGTAATELDTVTVTGYRASVEKALDIKRGEAGMVDAIVAEDIGKFPDSNLAESLQRIPGVVITRDGGEGRQITVRGLGPDFTRVRINGMEALSTVGSSDGQGGTNRSRGFDFNVFASDLFSQLVARKTASADVDEGSLGATVDLRTARPFDYDGLTVVGNVQAAYNDASESAMPRFAGLVANSWPTARSVRCCRWPIPSARPWKKAPAPCAGPAVTRTAASTRLRRSPTRCARTSMHHASRATR